MNNIQIKCCCDAKTTYNLSEVMNMNTDQKVISILSTILDRCKKEKDSNCLQVPLDDYYERVAYYTAYPKLFIYHMIDGNPFQKEVIDLYDHILLLECINSIYSEKNLARFKNLYDEFRKFNSVRSMNYKATTLLDFKSFEIKLSVWGYVFKKTSDGTLLMENPKLKFDRFNYLNKIKHYRQNGRQIYYVDERQIFKDAIKKYCSVFDEDKQPNMPGFIYFYLISQNGYENGLFVYQDTDKTFEEIFKKWMTDIVLHSIKPSSVIVMENKALHGLLPRKPITRYHSKNQMVQWLKENNIPCDRGTPKPKIYELIEKCTKINEDYEIDRIFKACGHDVLRLPATFASLTPSTFLWQHLVMKFDVSEGTSVECVRDLVLQNIQDLKTNDWNIFTNIVVSMENDIYEIDSIAEILLEHFEIDSKNIYE